jgi:4-amino-4-deoxy-L-arabinose transferase-like glycosyltransferase
MSTVARHQLVVFAAAACVFFTLLGSATLWDEDEPKNAACAHEMLEAGDWITPRFNHQLRTDKPILLYWLMFVSYSLWGETEFAARFWSAVAAIGTSLVTYHLGRRLYSPAVGLWSGLAMAACVMFGVSGRAATPDSILIFSTTLAFYSFVRFGGITEPALRRGGYLATYAAMALAVLAKGPVGFVLPSAVIGLFRLCRREAESRRNERSITSDNAQGASSGAWYARWTAAVFRTLAPRRVVATTLSLKPWVLVAALVVIALPWYAAVGVRTEGAWLAGFLGTHNVARFTGAMEGHSGSIAYYPLAILVGFFPWSCLLPIGLYRIVVRLRSDERLNPADVFLAAWAGLYVTFFTLAGTKLPSYVLPCYPALAVITGKLIDEWLTTRARVPRTWFHWALATPAIVGGVLAVALPIAAYYLLPGETWPALCGLGSIGVPLVAGSLASAWLLRNGRAAWVPAAFALTAVVFVTGLVGGAASRISRHATSPAIVRAAREAAGPAAPLIAFRHYEPTLVYYSRDEVPTVDTVEHLLAELRRRPNACVVTREEHLSDLALAFSGAPEIAARRRRFLRRRGEVVLAIPPTTADAVARERSDLRR